MESGEAGELHEHEADDDEDGLLDDVGVPGSAAAVDAEQGSAPETADGPEGEDVHLLHVQDDDAILLDEHRGFVDEGGASIGRHKPLVAEPSCCRIPGQEALPFCCADHPLESLAFDGEHRLAPTLPLRPHQRWQPPVSQVFVLSQELGFATPP